MESAQKGTELLRLHRRKLMADPRAKQEEDRQRGPFVAASGDGSVPTSVAAQKDNLRQTAEDLRATL